jgi:chromosome segregation ATPase
MQRRLTETEVVAKLAADASVAKDARIATLEEERHLLTNMSITSKAELEAAYRQIATLGEEVASLQSSLRTANAAHAQAVADQDARETELRAQLLTNDAAHAALSKECAIKTTQLHETHEAMKALQEQHEAQRVAAEGVYKRQMEEEQAARVTLQRTVEELREQATVLQCELEALRQQQQEQQHRAQEEREEAVGAERQELEQVKTLLLLAQNRLAALQAQNEQYLNTAATAETRIRDLTRLLADSEARARAADAELEVLRGSIDKNRLEAEEDHQQALEQLRMTAKTAEAAAEELKLKLAQMELRAQTAESGLEALRVSADQDKQRLEEIHKQSLEQLRNDAINTEHEQRDRIVALEAELEALRGQTATWSRDVEAAQNTVSVLTQELARLRDRQQQEENTSAQDDDDDAAAADGIEALEAELRESRRQLEAEHVRRADLENKLSHMLSQHHKERAELEAQLEEQQQLKLDALQLVAQQTQQQHSVPSPDVHTGSSSEATTGATSHNRPWDADGHIHIQRLQQEVSDLKQSFIATMEMLKTQQIAVAEERWRRQKSQEEVLTLRQENAVLVQNIAELQRRVPTVDLASELQHLKSQFSLAAHTLKTNKSRIDELQKQLDAKDHALRESQSLLSREREKLRVLILEYKRATGSPSPGRSTPEGNSNSGAPS